MDYDEFADRFLIGVYWETEHNNQTFIRAGTIIDKYKLTPRPSWISRMADDLEYSYFKDISKTLGGYDGWSFRITAEGCKKVESQFADDDEMFQFLNSVPDENANIPIPAADRIVRLDHNQISEADASVSAVISALEVDNGNPEIAGLRERLLGQMRAARELIRVGEYKAYLMYELLVRTLGEIIKRYGNPTIIALANALLGALVSKLIDGS
jgi:hypothetical protein